MEEAQRLEEERRLEEARREQQAHEDELRAASEARERELKKRGAYVVAGLALLIASIGVGGGLWALHQKSEADKQRGIAEAQRTEADKQRGIADYKTQEVIAEKAKVVTEERQVKDALSAAKKLQSLLRAKNDAYYASDLVNESSFSLDADPDSSAKLALDAFAYLSLRHEPAAFQVQNALHQVAGTWREKLVLSDFREPVRQVTFSPDGSALATVDEKGALKVWDSFSGKAQRTLADQGASCVAYSLNGNLVFGRRDGSVEIRDGKGTPVARLPVNPDKPVKSVASSPDGKWVALATEGKGVISLWDGKSGGELRELKGHEKAVNALAFSPDGRRLASGSDDNTVRLWNVDKQQQLFDSLDLPSSVQALAFSPDGLSLAATILNRIAIFTVDPEGPTTIRFFLYGYSPALSGLAFSPNGDLAAGGSDGAAWLWHSTKVSSGGLPLRGHSGAVHDVAFSPDATRLATAGEDNTARIRDTALTRELRTYQAAADVPVVPVPPRCRHARS